jgi:Skp family chaperone for outer membrane proteins
MLNYGINIFLLIMLTSVAHAEVFKCLLASDKVVYQSAPCQSAVKQEIVEIKKSDPRKVAEAEANLKAWEEDFAKREAVRKKAEKELQAEMDRQRLQSNMPAPYQQYQFPPYYSPYPFYRFHHWPNMNGRNFHKH